MIKLKVLIILILLAWMSGVFASEDGNNGVSFEALAKKLEQAIESRNFTEARLTLEELLPLMKRELKEHKKLISDLQKSESPEAELEVHEENFNRKNEIYNVLKVLSDGSVAALRAKSQLIREEVGNFVALAVDT